jgi:hypothetical protein
MVVDHFRARGISFVVPSTTEKKTSDVAYEAE